MTTELAPVPPRVAAFDAIDDLAVNTIRMLAADAVQAAGSGHPGLPMGVAAPAWVLWSRFLRHDPTAPEWPDRDRFVLSAGHGSMLLYALLHLFGYGLEVADLRAFRQWGSGTPGHPEFGHTVGVETTTGPLGQGLGNAVGMALAECMLAARANTVEHAIVDHRTWVVASDGDLMEGISHEAGSLAGHLGLGRLTVIYDDNDITIDGRARQSCSDDAAARFESYGWQTIRVPDGNDLDALADAYAEAIDEETRPCLISVRTTIGYGAPTLAGTSRVHGAPLGEAELAATRAVLDWPEQRFHVPSEVARRCAEVAAEGAAVRREWERARAEWAKAEPERASTWPLRPRAEAGPYRAEHLPEFEHGTSVATRSASGEVIAALAEQHPDLVGGSADLAASTNTTIPNTSAVQADDFHGRTIHFGIREHAMSAALNGIALHGGLRPYGSTFLVFSDYLRPSVRLSALMGLPVVFVFTHDSIAVGEDGPTHQPVEHIESLRLIPNLAVLRPADAHETAACWDVALRRTSGPSALILSRQALPVLDPVSGDVLEAVGARVAVEGGALPDVLLVGTGSEVHLAVEAAEALRGRGLRARVLSVPWRERFEESGTALLPGCPAVWIEAGVPHGWQALARPGDVVLGLRRFGASAPGPVVYGELGFTVAAVVESALSVMRTSSSGRPRGAQADQNPA